MGQYSPGTGATACIDCATGRYNPLIQQGSEFACTGPLPPLTSNVGNHGVCSAACAPGKYGEQVMATACDACVAGKYNMYSGSRNISACVECPQGLPGPGPLLMWSLAACTANRLPRQDDTAKRRRFGCSSSARPCISHPTSHSLLWACHSPLGTPQECQLGKWSNRTGQQDESTCRTCPYGKTTHSLASTDLTDCVGCPRGKYGDPTVDASMDQCTPCPRGTYNPRGEFISAVNVSECILCIKGKASDVLGAFNANTCQDCQEGR